MTIWIPEWRITVGQTIYTNVTDLSLTVGRTDINKQVQAGYARVNLINPTNSYFDIDVTDSVTIEVKNSAGVYVYLFGGYVSDFNVGVTAPTTEGFVTQGTMIVMGSLAKLPKVLFTTSLSLDQDGDQIYTVLKETTGNSWLQVAPSLTWATYDPTVEWQDAEVYIGTIDRPGNYDMAARSAFPEDSYSVVAQIAASGLGQIFEDNQGRICYSDSDARTIALGASGYTVVDSINAVPSTIKNTLQLGKIRNDVRLAYGAGYAYSVTLQDDVSLALYGRFTEFIQSNIDGAIQAASVAERILKLRAFPRESLESISFRLDNEDLSDADRDDLIGTYFGMPVSFTNLPLNMFNGQFDGFVEGWTMKASPQRADITITASPTEFSMVALQWYAVNASEQWDTISPTLTWEQAIGVIA